jgi:hypothetical protein
MSSAGIGGSGSGGGNTGPTDEERLCALSSEGEPPESDKNEKNEPARAAMQDDHGTAMAECDSASSGNINKQQTTTRSTSATTSSTTTTTTSTTTTKTTKTTNQNPSPRHDWVCCASHPSSTLNSVHHPHNREHDPHNIPAHKNMQHTDE